MKTIFFPLFLLVLLLGIAPLTQAAPPAKPTPKPKATPVHIVIQSVSADSITISHGAKSTTYKIDKNTRCSIDGQTAKVSDLKSGMHVSVVPGGSDDKTAVQIDATDPSKSKSATGSKSK